MNKAREEIGNYCLYSYILVNDILDKAVEELTAIVQVERHRRGEPASPDESRLDRLANSCRQENAQERIASVLRCFGLHARDCVVRSGVR